MSPRPKICPGPLGGARPGFGLIRGFRDPVQVLPRFLAAEPPIRKALGAERLSHESEKRRRWHGTGQMRRQPTRTAAIMRLRGPGGHVSRKGGDGDWRQSLLGGRERHVPCRIGCDPADRLDLADSCDPRGEPRPRRMI
ncbi:hypothetical protein LCGC14_1505420 [marine sediment metagenome]|uniref:Uncharacterized protein n=1 Tax=marine sediment metagenome TaxID=412755 RepID=A0A0F9LI72_9ZZZZ